ncbi:T9SS type A sorting domain-containing protein [Crocinitomix catalasitica]|nr:T9SS type A sorting domain-containing protein [Crocinitomix catalasitica]
MSGITSTEQILLNIFPNPINLNDQFLNINSPNSEGLFVYFYDLLGHELFTLQLESAETEIDLVELNMMQGIYQVVIVTTEGILISKRLSVHN